MPSSQRQYQMLFSLAAQMNSKFQGTFTSAQKILQQTQKEIQALNRVQSDISAYQKAQKGLESSQAKLEMYRSQLATTREALEKLKSTENASAVEITELTNLETKLTNQINSAELAVHDKTKRLEEMQKALQQSGVDMNDLSGESARLANAVSDLQKQEEQAAEEAENLGVNGQDAFDALSSALVASGIVNGLHELYDAYSECVSISMEFSSTISTVEALSGANAQEIRDLSQQARDLGASTVFTANQAASAMTYMGMAGWNAQQMMSGMDGVLNLAAAAGEDLAMVSDIVTDNLTAFGLSANDTAHFADVLAAAATNSNTSVSIMGETFKSSASIAGALGYSVEDVAVMVGLMANSGVKGSIAGTALKNTFNGLLEGATLTADAFGEYEYTAVKADGTMKGLSETINELRGYFEQMTEAERVNNAMALAGQRGYNGLLAILNATDEDYQSLYNSINNCTGAAQRMADIKLDNLKGDVTLLQSATEGLQETIGGLFEDELRSGTQVITEIMTSINEFAKSNPALVKGLMALVTEVGLVVGAFAAYAAIKKVVIALNLQSAASFVALHAKMLIALGVLALVTAAVVAWREAVKVANLEEQTLTTATEEQQEKVADLTDEYNEACEAYGETSDRARALKYDLDEATAAVESQSFSVSELYNEIDALHSSTSELLANYSNVKKETEENYEAAQVLSAKLKEIGNSSETAAQKQTQMEPIIKRLNELYPSLGLTVENVSEKLYGLSDAIDAASGTGNAQEKYEAAKANYDELILQQAELQEAVKKSDVAVDEASDAFLKATGNGDVWTSLVGVINGTATDTQKALEEAQNKNFEVRNDLYLIEQQIAECEEAMKQYSDTVNGTSEEMVSSYDAVSIAMSGVEEEAEALIQAYNDAYQAAYDSVSGQFNLWTEAEKSIPTSVGQINNALSSQQSYWDNYSANLEKLLGKTGKIDGLRDVLASFADGSQESVNAIAGMANASDEQLEKMVENYRKAQEEEQKVAGLLAEVKVDINNELDDITNKMSAAVQNMNMETDARNAANNTIRAYTQALAAGAGTAYSAAQTVKNAAAAAFAGTPMPNNTYGPQKGYANAYASGTTNAQEGWALVGENGPEVVYMRGGETVYNSDTTKEMLGGTQITIAPSFVVNGGTSEEQLRDYSERLVDMVKEALNEAGIDRQRSVYA